MFLLGNVSLQKQKTNSNQLNEQKDLLAHLTGMSRGRAGFRVDYFQWFNSVLLSIEVLLLSSGCLSVYRSFRFTSSNRRALLFQNSLHWEQLRPMVHELCSKEWKMLTTPTSVCVCVCVCVLDIDLKIQHCKDEGRKKPCWDGRQQTSSVESVFHSMGDKNMNQSIQCSPRPQREIVEIRYIP